MTNKTNLKLSAIAIFSAISLGAQAQSNVILEKCGNSSAKDKISSTRICVGFQLLKSADTRGKKQDVVTIGSKVFEAKRKDVTEGRIGAKIEEVSFQLNKTTSAVLTLSSVVRPGASSNGSLTFFTPKKQTVVVEKMEMKAVRSGPQ